VRETPERKKKRAAEKVDAKFGARRYARRGAMRFRQLQGNVPDDAENQLDRLYTRKPRQKTLLGKEDFQKLRRRIRILSELDHNHRACAGR